MVKGRGRFTRATSTATNYACQNRRRNENFYKGMYKVHFQYRDIILISLYIHMYVYIYYADFSIINCNTCTSIYRLH